MATGMIQEPISRDRVYTREQVKDVCGWAEDALQRAFRAGLRKSKRHGRVYVSGHALAEYLTGESVAGGEREASAGVSPA